MMGFRAELARSCNRDVGLLSMKEHDCDLYTVYHALIKSPPNTPPLPLPVTALPNTALPKYPSKMHTSHQLRSA